MKCIICEEDMVFIWSDTHAVGVCRNCGMPYKILHYGTNRKVDYNRLPEPAVKDEWIQIGKRYWNEMANRVFPAAYDVMGLSRDTGRTYSGASESEIHEWRAWLDAHKDELPKKEPSP